MSGLRSGPDGVDHSVPLFAERYEVGPVVGRGGMAEVRAARDTRLDRPVAIKIMRPEVAHQALVRTRFEVEARLAARLIHPNVVAVFDSGEHAGLPYIVMERLPGETLHDRLAHGPMGEPEVRHLALEVLAALETAHAAGILHRDIKPANVLATGDGHWKVTDFGIAKALEVGGGDATATGLVLGTPAYVAPERLLGAPATVASDIYSLGVMLYEALSGRRPFDNGAAGGWPGVVSGAPLVPLRSLRRDVDPVLAGAIERCLAREPSERFWSAAEISAALGGRPNGERTEAAPTAAMAAGPATEILQPGFERAAFIDAGTAARWPRVTTARLLAGLAGLTVLAAVILGAVGAGSSGGSPATSPSDARRAATTTVPPPTSTSTSTTSTTSTTVVTVAPPPGKDGGPGGGPGSDGGPPGKHKH